MGVGVAVGSGVYVAVGVWVSVGVGVLVAVGTSVSVGVEVGIGVCVAVGGNAEGPVPEDERLGGADGSEGTAGSGESQAASRALSPASRMNARRDKPLSASVNFMGRRIF